MIIILMMRGKQIWYASHGGGTSHGCVTVSTNLLGGSGAWRGIEKIIRNTISVQQPFTKGRFPWEPLGKVTSYGIMVVE